MELNNQKYEQKPPLPATISISIENILQYRIALEQIRSPSQEMKGAMLNLDVIIHNFTKSLNFGAR